MKCFERERLFALAHGLLEAGKEAEARAHLRACPACRQVVTEYLRLDAVLEEWKPAEPSPQFDARVRQAVAAAGETRNSPGWLSLCWRWWWAPASAAVLIAIAMLVILRGHRTSNPVPPMAGNTPQRSVQPETAPHTQPPIPTAEVKPTTPVKTPVTGQSEEEEMSLYKNLPVLEDYDLLANFDVLSELPQGEKKVAN